MPLRLVAFELSGVIVDEWGEFAALDAAMAAARERWSLQEAPDELSGEFSLRLMDLIAAEPPPGAAGDHEAPPSPFQPFEMAAKEILVEMLDARGFAADAADAAWFWATLIREHREKAKPHADAPKVLRALQEEGLHLAIITDTDPALAEASLEGAGLRGWFDSVTTARDVGYVKPSPKIFEAALGPRAVAPNEALMVGPSYERDVMGARKAGLHALLMDRHDARTVGRDEKITNLRKLMPHVRELLQAP